MDLIFKLRRGSKVILRNGKNAEIVSVNCIDTGYPIRGYIEEFREETWDKDGYYISGNKSEWDIVEIKDEIVREIQTFNRAKEILESMPNPKVKTRIFTGGVPTLFLEFKNEGGVCVYKFKHSGWIGMKDVQRYIQKMGLSEF